MFFVILCCALVAPPALAQQQAPDFVIEAVGAIEAMLDSEGDPPIEDFIGEAMVADPERELGSAIAELRSIREALRGLRDDIAIEAEDDGIRMILSSADTEKHLRVVLGPEGIASMRVLEGASPPVIGLTRENLEEIFQDIQGDLRFDHELNGCLNCGICTATCPAAHYYDFSPREIVQLLWTENLEGIYDAMQEKIWSCAQCYTCAARCPFGNSPGGLVMLMRETAIKHGMESAKSVLRPFSRVMLKLISTGNQLSPDMINPEGFADWGPNVSKVDAPLATLRKAIPMPTLHTTKTAWEVNLKTSVELYTIWEETGVLDSLETIDENLFDVILDIMDEKRDDYEDWMDEQDDD